MQHFYRPTQLLLILFVSWTFEQCLPAAATCYLSFWRNSVTIVCYCVFAAEAVKRNHRAEQLRMLRVIDHFHELNEW